MLLLLLRTSEHSKGGTHHTPFRRQGTTTPRDRGATTPLHPAGSLPSTKRERASIAPPCGFSSRSPSTPARIDLHSSGFCAGRTSCLLLYYKDYLLVRLLQSLGCFSSDQELQVHPRQKKQEQSGGLETQTANPRWERARRVQLEGMMWVLSSSGRGIKGVAEVVCGCDPAAKKVCLPLSTSAYMNLFLLAVRYTAVHT